MITTITTLSVFALICSIAGNILINMKNRAGYIIWIIGNILWIVINYIDHMNVSQVVMYIIYLILNIQGFIKWSRDNSKR